MEQTDPGAAEDGQNGQQRRRDQKDGRGGGIDVLKAVRFLAAADDAVVGAVGADERVKPVAVLLGAENGAFAALRGGGKVDVLGDAFKLFAPQCGRERSCGDGAEGKRRAEAERDEKRVEAAGQARGGAQRLQRGLEPEYLAYAGRYNVQRAQHGRQKKDEGDGGLHPGVLAKLAGQRKAEADPGKDEREKKKNVKARAQRIDL